MAKAVEKLGTPLSTPNVELTEAVRIWSRRACYVLFCNLTLSSLTMVHLPVLTGRLDLSVVSRETLTLLKMICLKQKKSLPHYLLKMSAK